MVARFFVRSIFWLPPRGKLRCGGRQTAPYRCVNSRKPGRDGLSGAQNRRFWCQNAAAVRFWTEKPPAVVRCARKSPHMYFAYGVIFWYTRTDTQISDTEEPFYGRRRPCRRQFMRTRAFSAVRSVQGKARSPAPIRSAKLMCGPFSTHLFYISEVVFT